MASRLDSGSSSRSARRLADQRARERNTLALAAGELARSPVEKVADTKQLRGPLAPSFRFPRQARAACAAERRCCCAPCNVDRGRSSETSSPRRGRAAGMSLTTLPPIKRSPLVCCSSPQIMRKNVVLPQPDGPSSTMNSPSGTVSEMPLTAGTSPNFLTISLVNTAAIEPPRIQRTAPLPPITRRSINFVFATTTLPYPGPRLTARSGLPEIRSCRAIS